MSTIIYKTNGDILTTINDYETDTNTSPLTLLGRGVMNNGSADQTNMIKILENFCAPVSPKKAIEGQLWYNNFTSDSYGNETPVYKLYFNTNNSELGLNGWLYLADKRDIDTINGRLNDNAEELSQIQKHLTDHDNSISTINGNIVTINTDIGNLQKEIDQINTQLTTINGNIVTINTDIGNLQKEIDQINKDSSKYVLKNNNMPDSNGYSGDLGNTNSHYSTIYATTFNGTAIRANWADLAEIYESDKKYPIGTIVKIGGEKEITTTKNKNDDKIIGVISEYPALLMNSSFKKDNTLPVALLGRVKVRIIGKIKKGDFIVSSSIDGVGIVDNTTVNPKCIVGISLENSDNKKEKTVLCYVGK